jgi:hypothetical protein
MLDEGIPFGQNYLDPEGLKNHLQSYMKYGATTTERPIVAIDALDPICNTEDKKEQNLDYGIEAVGEPSRYRNDLDSLEALLASRPTECHPSD